MKKLLLGCAGLALFASVMSVMLWRDLRAERELNAALQTRLAEAEAGAVRPPALPVAARQPVTAQSPGKAELPPSATAARTEPAVQNFVPNVGINERDMLKDPDYRKARLAQIRLQLPERYPGLAEDLSLSPEQLDRLFDLLAENQLEMNTNTTLVRGPNGQIDQTQMQEVQRRQQELRTKQDAALGALLGDARMDKWQEYQQTQASRQRVAQLGRTLDAMGMPLTSAQRRPLADAMAAEQARQLQDQQDMMRELRAASPQGQNSQMDPQIRARMQEENFRRQADSNRRLLDVAAAHLNARQLELFRAQLESQLTLNRASSRMQREAADQNRSAAPVIVTAPAATRTF
jgi:hypothetical protein